VIKPSQPVWYSLVAVGVSVVLIAVTSVVLSQQARQEAQRAARESERRWCGLVVSLDDSYRVAPPQTPVGRRMAAELATLRAQFGCPPPVGG
jgi:hypothetical protein